jgi:hypothetical protein
VKLSKLVVSVALVAAIAFFAPRAGAQTMGEYATTTGVSTGAGSMSSATASAPSFGSSLGGGTRTWGTSSYGASWEERASANSASSGGDFSSRAEALTGHSAGGGETRFPGSGFTNLPERASLTTDRFQGSGDRFAGSGSRFSSGDSRFSASKFSNSMGLDTSFNSISGN